MRKSVSFWLSAVTIELLAAAGILVIAGGGKSPSEPGISPVNWRTEAVWDNQLPIGQDPPNRSRWWANRSQ